jgi:hypothetical protein
MDLLQVEKTKHYKLFSLSKNQADTEKIIIFLENKIKNS